MPSVSETLVREFLELNGFLVRQPYKYQVVGRRSQPEEDVDFVILNPIAREHEVPETPLWGVAELLKIRRGVVSVRGWHTERIGAPAIQRVPELTRFTSESVLRLARSMLGEGPVARILCVSELPAARAARDQVLAMLREKGVDGVMLFRTILYDLVTRIAPEKKYESSDVLQVLRILKRYDLLKQPQLELFGRRRRS